MKNQIIEKSFLIWLGIIPLAFINGTVREFVLTPNIGKNISLPLSSIILCGLIFLLSYVFIPRLGSADKKTFFKMGILWAIATVAFEFIMGLLMGKSVSDAIAQYNPSDGNLWFIVILFTTITPFTVAKIKKYI